MLMFQVCQSYDLNYYLEHLFGIVPKENVWDINASDFLPLSYAILIAAKGNTSRGAQYFLHREPKNKLKDLHMHDRKHPAHLFKEI